MTNWNNYNVYYTDLNKLIVSCIEPFFRLQKWPGVKYFWERNYVGGLHLRLRFLAPLECLLQFDAALVGHIQEFLQVQPSIPDPSYSAARCHEMLALDGEEASPDDSLYRVNEIRSVPYQRFAHVLPSSATVSIIEDFLQDAHSLAAWIISQPDAVRLNVLRLYFWMALFLCGDLPRGSVSYKSHWSGFAASCRNRALIERIRSSYGEHARQLAEIMCQVREAYGETGNNPPYLLAQWQSLLNKYTARIRAEIENGFELTPRMKTVADIQQGRDWVSRNTTEASDFLNLLYDNDANLLLLGQDAGMTVARVLTNLLYLFIPLVGMSFLDKMCLCHYAYKSVEDYFHCNLTDIADATLKRLRVQNEAAITAAGRG